MRNIIYAILISIIPLFNIDMMAQDLYFLTPKESVKIISKLLLDENWEELSNYYFLDNANKEVIDSLRNGDYFIRTKRPEVAHPAGFWRYKKPFPPNFDYLSHIEIARDTVKVEVAIEIDQGMGMIQQGKTSFYLIESEKGYQLLL
jgi:hypothetical protein